MKFEISANQREAQGTGASRRLRRTGKVPGIVYGGNEGPVHNELDIVCFPDDLPEYLEIDLSNLTVGHSMHVRDLTFPKGVELALHKDENPVVATVVIPSLITEEEEAAAAAAAVAPSEIPTTEQAAAPKEGEEGAEGAAAPAKGGEKGAPAAAKGGEKPPPAAGKGGK